MGWPFLAFQPLADGLELRNQGLNFLVLPKHYIAQLAD